VHNLFNESSVIPREAGPIPLLVMRVEPGRRGQTGGPCVIVASRAATDSGGAGTSASDVSSALTRASLRLVQATKTVLNSKRVKRNTPPILDARPAK
jgi:hypothetical protein